MYELSDDAQRSLHWAHLEAQSFGSGVTGTEHLILGLLRLREVDHAIPMAFSQYGITLESARNSVATMHPRVASGGLTKSSPNLLSVLGMAFVLASPEELPDGEDHEDHLVSARHFLLAILSNRECGGENLIVTLGADVEKLSIEFREQ